MHKNTQGRGASSILHGSAKTPEIRQLTLTLPCADSTQPSNSECENGKIKPKRYLSPHAKNKEFYPQEGISQAKKKEFYPHEDTPFLQIQSVPITQRVDPERHSYVLVVQPIGVRACGGQYSASEAHEIAKLTKGWDWTLDPDDKPRCLPRLEALLDRICKRSSLGNEASEAGQLGLFLTKPLPSDEASLVKKLQNEGGEV